MNLSSLPQGFVSAAYAASVSATGGTPPYVWHASSGSLPPGISLDGAGALSGTPTAAGTYNFVATVVDSYQPSSSATGNFSIIISPGLQITTNSLPDGNVGVFYSVNLAASGGVSPYSWKIEQGSLPVGLELNAASGVISGVATASGTSNFTVQVADAETPPAIASANLTITVIPFATSYSCAGSGNRNWHTATDWSPPGIPAAGDTVTITAGCIMQCEANSTCTTGKSGNPGSVDMTIDVGGDFVVQSGASVDMRGDVTMSGELDIFGGRFLLDPSGAGSSLYYIDGGSDTGADTLKICSESTCSSNTGTLGILQCNKGNTGACQLHHTSHAGNGMNVLGSHGQISNFGNSSTAAISLIDGAYPPTGGFVLKNNFSLHSNGVIQVDYENPALDLTFDGVSFDTLVDVNGSYNGYSFMDLLSVTTPTSGNRTFRVSCANTGTRQALFNLDVTNIAVGDSTHPGLVSYNCVLANDSRGGTFQNALNVVDRNVNSGSALWTAYNSNSLFENWVMYDHTPNQHSIVGLNINGGGTTNSYKGMLFDGDGYAALDYGDDYQDFGTYSASYGLHINSSGTLYTLSATATQTGSFDHETMYNSYGGALCETGCTATMLKNVSNSLFVLPAEFLGAEYNGNDGMHIGSHYSYPYRQTALSSATDYNFFWQMPGSGDPGANPAKDVHIQLNLNGTPSWVAITDPGANLVTNQPATINGTNVTCTNCFTNAHAKDYIVDTTQTPNQYSVIAIVTDPSHATLYFSIPGWNNSDRVDVRPGYFASNGYYGVDWGTHDQHVNPVFQDPTRDVCSWWKQQSGSTANCVWPNGNNYTATAGTNSTTIVDTAVDFDTLGVQDGVDVVLVYNTGWAPVGSATVVSHTATSLTVSSIPGAASGDSFTFITAPQNLGLAAVQIYGFDVNGNQVTPPEWVNENIVTTIQSYVQDGFAPTNPALFGAASDGQTVGAVQF